MKYVSQEEFEKFKAETEKRLNKLELTELFNVPDPIPGGPIADEVRVVVEREERVIKGPTVYVEDLRKNWPKRTEDGEE